MHNITAPSTPTDQPTNSDNAPNIWEQRQEAANEQRENRVVNLVPRRLVFRERILSTGCKKIDYFSNKRHDQDNSPSSAIACR